MFIEYLEKVTAELNWMENKLQVLEKEYRKGFDRQAREEINGIKKEIKTKKLEIGEKIYENLWEMRLIKKHFPALFTVYIEHETIGPVLKNKMWLIDFKGMPIKECEKKINEIKNKRKQLKESIKFLKGWVGSIDAKSMVATWNVFKDVLKEKDKRDKDEVLALIKEMNKASLREGWLVMLNEPLILKPLYRFFTLLKKAYENEYEKKNAFEKSKGKGSISEYNTTKELREAQKKRMRIEKLCRHLLLANSHFLAKIKTNKPTWRNKSIDNFIKGFLNSIKIPNIDEKKWLNEIKSKLL